MPRRPCGCYGTVSNDGNRHKPTEKSLPDERSIRLPFSHQTSLILLHLQTAEILTLLFEATQSPPSADPTQHTVPPLEPTAGTRPRIDNYLQIKWEEDASRPGGGIFVTKDPSVTKELTDIGEGVIVNEPVPGDSKTSATDGQGDTATSPATDRALPSASTSTFANSTVPQSNGSGSMDNPIPDTFNMFEGVPGNMFDWSAFSSAFFPSQPDLIIFI